jgi:hypothetical protein
MESSISMGRRHQELGLFAGIVGASVFMYLHCRGRADACDEESMAYYGAFGMAGAGIGHLLPKGTAWRKVYEAAGLDRRRRRD